MASKTKDLVVGVDVPMAIPEVSNAVYRNRIVGFEWRDPDPNLFTFNPLNPRIHPQEQNEALDAVLRSIGWVTGVIENVTTGNLVDGEDRVKQAVKAGERIPVLLVQLSLEEEKALLATFDAITEMAGKDREKFTALIEQAREGMRDLLSGAMRQRMHALLESVRERHGRIEVEVLPPQPSDAEFTENKYPVPDWSQEERDEETGEVVREAQEQRMRVVQLYFTLEQYNTYTPILRGLAKHFEVANITDTLCKLIEWGAEVLHIDVSEASSEAQEEPSTQEADPLIS